MFPCMWSIRWESFFVIARRRLSSAEGSSPLSGLGEGEASSLLGSGGGVGFSSSGFGAGSSGSVMIGLGRRCGGGSIIGL